MPSGQALNITVVLNSSQDKKTPVVLPATTAFNPLADKSCHELVIKAAQGKLRLKKSKTYRISVAKDGAELKTEDNWQRALKKEAVLLVSAGEEYVGAEREEGGGMHRRFRCVATKQRPVLTYFCKAEANPNCSNESGEQSTRGSDGCPTTRDHCADAPGAHPRSWTTGLTSWQ